MPHPFINASRDGSTTEFKPKQLPGVEHLPVVLVPPSVEAIRFIAFWYLVVGNKAGLHGMKHCFGFGVSCQVSTIWFLEEPSCVLCFASFAVIFDGKHAVLRRTRLRIRIGIDRVAMGALAPIALGGPQARKLRVTRLTHTWVLPTSGFG